MHAGHQASLSVPSSPASIFPSPNEIWLIRRILVLIPCIPAPDIDHFSTPFCRFLGLFRTVSLGKQYEIGQKPHFSAKNGQKWPKKGQKWPKSGPGMHGNRTKMPIFDKKWSKIGSYPHKIVFLAFLPFREPGFGLEKNAKSRLLRKSKKMAKNAIFGRFFWGGGVEMRSISLTHRNYFRNPKNDAFLDILHWKINGKNMPQLIALTTGYAQFVQASYLLLPIFGKSTIFGIFRKSGKIGFFGHFLSIFGHFFRFFDIFWQNFHLMGDFLKSGQILRILVVGAVFSQKSDTVARTEIDFSCYRVFFTRIDFCVNDRPRKQNRQKFNREKMHAGHQASLRSHPPQHPFFPRQNKDFGSSGGF